LRQIFVQGRLQTGSIAAVVGDDHHHLTRSSRAKIGELALLVDEAGGRFEGILESVNKSQALLRVTRPLPAEPALAPLTLALCLPKAEALDACLDAATQLGVTHFVPLSSARSQEFSSSRQERWQRIVRMSCCQCLRARPMELSAPRELETFLPQSGPGRKFLAWQGAAASNTSLAGQEALTYLVGPEGGFEDSEIAAAKESGWELISLGPRILRVPVAVAAGLGALQAMRL